MWLFSMSDQRYLLENKNNSILLGTQRHQRLVFRCGQMCTKRIFCSRNIAFFKQLKNIFVLLLDHDLVFILLLVLIGKQHYLHTGFARSIVQISIIRVFVKYLMELVA